MGFVGAMGARSTAARRTELLHQAGIGDEALRRLHAPLGLDLGGSTPTETALSILAEITAARHSASGLPLRDLAGPLHPRADAVREAAVVATGCSISLAGSYTVMSPQSAVRR